MYAVTPGFIAARGYYASAAHSADDEWFAFETAIPEAFDRDKEGIQVQMKHSPIVHEIKYKALFDEKYVIKKEICISLSIRILK
jgi:hypothetical protein